jgi:FtsP/CotA-like multicopper oxidase with cupredoxin domain
MTTSGEFFPTDVAGLARGRSTEVFELADGDEFDLRIAPVVKQLGDATARMLAYNGSIPGPTLRVPEGSELVVNVVNEGDLEETVHWHGLRLDNRYDGTHLTQDPIPVGGSFTYRLKFPDPGIYWYHPHVRADYGQELGLYGTIIVVPAEADYWPPVNRELAVTLDDVLIEDGKIAPFRRSEATFAAMGRFGNVLLTNGETDGFHLAVRRGEVVRFYLTDTANSRVFRVALPGARMKRVGADSGRYERETFVEDVILGPSERVVVDVLFDEPGELMLEHRTPERAYPLARISVADEQADPSYTSEFERLRGASELEAERERLSAYLAAEPDKTVALVAEMDLPSHGTGGHKHGHGHSHETADDGIEWEDEMLEVNRATTPENVRWKLVDRATGAEGHAIDWRFRVGDRVKIRVVNEKESDHPMQHPFHVHGAGRFLILARDGVVEPNLAWKDTVLIPAGQVVDILLEVTNPGRWMAHCHIPEHHESGMMFSFDVDA